MSVEQTELCTLCSVGVTVTAAIDNHRETDNKGTTLIMVHGSEERDTKKKNHVILAVFPINSISIYFSDGYCQSPGCFLLL